MILSTEPYVIHTAGDGQEALDLCGEHNYDMILLDLMMPRVDGVAFLQKYKEAYDNPAKVIILSNLSSGDRLTNALELGAYKSLVKADVSPRQLVTMVRYELQSVAA